MTALFIICQFWDRF